MIQKSYNTGEPGLESRNLNWNVKAVVIAPRFNVDKKIVKLEFREWKFSVILN